MSREGAGVRWINLYSFGKLLKPGIGLFLKIAFAMAPGYRSASTARAGKTSLANN